MLLFFKKNINFIELYGIKPNPQLKKKRNIKRINK